MHSFGVTIGHRKDLSGDSYTLSEQRWQKASWITYNLWPHSEAGFKD